MARVRCRFRSIVSIALLVVPPVVALRTIHLIDPPPGMAQRSIERFYNETRSFLCRDCPPWPTPLAIAYSARPGKQGTPLLPEWGGGGAFGPDSIVVMPGPNPVLGPALETVTRHEVVHVVLFEICGTTAIPRWFHEGAAILLAGELSPGGLQALARSIVWKGAPTFAQVERVNERDREQAAALYAFSHAAVTFMVQNWGQEVLALVVAGCGKDQTFGESVDAVVGLTLPELEGLVRGFVARRYGILFWLLDVHHLWVLTAVLAVTAFVVTLIRRRIRMGKMEEGEAAGGQE